MNDDLVGKVYRNGDGGMLYRVIRVCRHDSAFVAAQSINGDRSATALADFVRGWIVREQPNLQAIGPDGELCVKW